MVACGLLAMVFRTADLISFTDHARQLSLSAADVCLAGTDTLEALSITSGWQFDGIGIGPGFTGCLECFRNIVAIEIFLHHGVLDYLMN